MPILSNIMLVKQDKTSTTRHAWLKGQYFSQKTWHGTNNYGSQLITIKDSIVERLDLAYDVTQPQSISAYSSHINWIPWADFSDRPLSLWKVNFHIFHASWRRIFARSPLLIDASDTFEMQSLEVFVFSVSWDAVPWITLTQCGHPILHPFFIFTFQVVFKYRLKNEWQKKSKIRSSEFWRGLNWKLGSFFRAF